jgi:hypothetical protein
MGKSIDYVLKNSTVIFYDKKIILDKCYVNFKVPDDCAFNLFTERLFTGAILELIDMRTNTVFEAEVLAISVGNTTYGSNAFGLCVLLLHGEHIPYDTFVF